MKHIAETQLSRRALLGAGAAVAAASLASCGRGADDSGVEPTPSHGPSGHGSSASTSRSDRRPEYVPYAGARADFPPTRDGVQAAYLRYPTERKRLHTSPIGRGGEVTSLSGVNQAAPPRLDKNRYWQELNERMGVTWKPTLAPAGQYTAKLQTTLAGNDLPDLVQFPYRRVPSLAGVLEHGFEPITDYVAGAKVRRFAGLANLTPGAWRTAEYNGDVYGVPLPNDPTGVVMMIRRDIVEQLGLRADINDVDDYLELCRGLTDDRAGRWAVASPSTAQVFANEIYRVPSSWEESGGQLTSAYETEEIKDALALLARMWKEGLFHPDSFVAAPTAANTWFMGGVIAMRAGTPGAWRNYKRGIANYPAGDKVQISALTPPSANGRPSRQILSPQASSMTAIRKGHPRVEEMLAVLDYLASPFGTEEGLFLWYGIEGYDFTWSEGDPVFTSQGKLEVPTTQPQGLARHPLVLYVPGFPGDTRAQHRYEKSMVPDGAVDPTVGLFSETDSTVGASLASTMRQVANDVMQGRKGPHDWEQAVAAWRKQGGDKIRSEYEAALAEREAASQ